MRRLIDLHPAGILLPFVAGLTVLLGSLAVGAAIGRQPSLGLAILASPLVIVLAWAAYKLPGVTFAAYLGIPFYKAATDPFLPIDLTLLLGLVNIMQAGLIFLPDFTRAGKHSANPRRRKALLIWFLLTVLILLGALYAPDPPIAFERAVIWIGLAALPLLAAFRIASKPRYLQQVLWTLFAIGAAVTIVGLITLPTIGAWPVDRLIVFGAHTIRVGQAALLVPLVTFPFILPTAKLPVRLACLGLVPFSLIVAASSGSRGPLLFGAITLVGFGVRALVTRVLRRRDQPVTIAPIRVAAIVLMAGLLVIFLQPDVIVGLLPEAAVSRLGTLSDIVSGLASQDLAGSAPDNSTVERLIAYEGAIDMFNRSPVFGQGTASFVQFTEAAGFTDWTVETAYPHNLVLQFASEYGLVGLVVGLVILVSAFRGLIPRSREPAWNAILVLLVFFLLSAIVSSGIIDNRTLWGLVVLGLAAPTADPGLAWRNVKQWRGPGRAAQPAPVG